MITTDRLRRRVNAAGFAVGTALMFGSAIMMVWGGPYEQFTWSLLSLLGFLLALTAVCFGIASLFRKPKSGQR